MTPRKPPSKEAMRLKMASLCSRGEQCEADVFGKLVKSGLSMADIEAILTFLKKERFIDNERFARAFSSDKLRFGGWGRNKIRMALAAKKVESSSISKALEALPEDVYVAKLEEVARAKARGLDLSLRQDVMKLYRHLLQRGFESSLAVAVIKKLR
ncbi:MAG: RecX family transcriptional regulator [Muribaculum sp.]|nr:RecX family transcriptional regulator [Muribaculum sp.]